jgi:hypothetical protein
MTHYIKYLLPVVCFVILTGCKKFADVDTPSNQLSSDNVFTTDATVGSAMAGLFSTLGTSDSYQLQLGISSYTAMTGDELIFNNTSDTYDPFVKNALGANNPDVQSLWTALYEVNYQANSIINGINKSTAAITDSVRTDALAESRFVRAFCHFYLVNIWGDVPLVTTTDVTYTKSLARSKSDTVYKQIIADLEFASANLNTNYTFSGGQRIMPNKYAAMAMLARVHLYMGHWQQAADYANTVISNGLYSLLSSDNIGSIMTENNQEAIWQLEAAFTTGYTTEGQYYLLISPTPSYLVTDQLLSAFEPGDLRYTNWIGTVTVDNVTYHYPYKYKVTANDPGNAEYATYLRLAEQYLIRAEANMELNNLDAAISDINIIRNRAGLGNTTATTKDQLKLAIEKERRLELFSEYGHRWMDLKRTGRIDAVLSAAKSNWTSTDALYPIPLGDIHNDPNLTQNPGY